LRCGRWLACSFVVDVPLFTYAGAGTGAGIAVEYGPLQFSQALPQAEQPQEAPQSPHAQLATGGS
jgi:hypothetical protein